jgi:hypothetical protein
VSNLDILDLSNFFAVVGPIISRSTWEMTTLKEEKSVKKPLSEEAKKEQAAKARATRLQHKMETLYSENQVDFSMEEKTIWEQKLEKEKEETVLQWDRLRKKEKNATKLHSQLLPMKGGGGNL